MTGLRLRKLPDRTPVKLTVSVAPELHQALLDYPKLNADGVEVRVLAAVLVLVRELMHHLRVSTLKLHASA